MAQNTISSGKHDANLTGPNNIPFTRAAILLPFVTYLKALGIPTEHYLRKANIPVSLINTPQAPLPLFLGHRFMEMVARKEGIDNLGLKVGERTTLDDIGPFGQLLQQTRTVYEYLQTGVRLIDSVTSGEQFWLTDAGDDLRFYHHIPYANDYCRRQSDWLTLIITINTLNKVTQGEWKPKALHIACGYEGRLPSQELLSDARISKGGKYSYFTLPKSLLKLPMPEIQIQESCVENLHQHLGSAYPAEFYGALEILIETLLLECYPDVHLAAEAAGTSTRTLQRRLTEMGLSYSKVINATRMRLATRWLVTTEMPIKEIAVALGYGDASNFTRAFRCRTGVTPKEYRYLKSHSHH